MKNEFEKIAMNVSYVSIALYPDDSYHIRGTVAANTDTWVFFFSHFYFRAGRVIPLHDLSKSPQQIILFL